MAPEVEAAYDAPFPDESYKAGARQFPMLVPSRPDDPAHDANVAAWVGLAAFDRPFLCAFSDSDPITKGADRNLKERIAGAQGQPHTTIVGGGHFLQEDCGEELAAGRRGLRRLHPVTTSTASSSSAPASPASAWRPASARMGIDDFVVLDRGNDLGGTWRDNSYPGAACDVPSNLYSFSFALNPDWSRVVLLAERDLGLHARAASTASTSAGTSASAGPSTRRAGTTTPSAGSCGRPGARSTPRRCWSGPPAR